MHDIISLCFRLYLLVVPITMKKKYILLVASTLIFLSSPSPVLAQTKTIQTQSKKTSGLHLLRMPKAVAGFCTGFVVGIPVCFVKKMPNEINDGAHGMVDGVTDNSDNKLLLGSAAILWLPAASITSFLEAPCLSFRNALKADKPFSKEQFSLDNFERE